jgi:hypothetical protein
MSLEAIHKAIYAALLTKHDVYVGIRVASMATPCYVYELTGATLDMSMGGVAAKNHWTIAVEVQAIADNIEDVTTLVDDLTGVFTGPYNDVTNKCSMVLSEFSVAFSVEPLDDGREDAARIGTISLTLLVQED